MDLFPWSLFISFTTRHLPRIPPSQLKLPPFPQLSLFVFVFELSIGLMRGWTDKRQSSHDKDIFSVH